MSLIYKVPECQRGRKCLIACPGCFPFDPPVRKISKAFRKALLDRLAMDKVEGRKAQIPEDWY